MTARVYIIVAWMIVPGLSIGQVVPRSPTMGLPLNTIFPGEEYIDSIIYEGFEDTTTFPPAGWAVVEISGSQGGMTPIPWHLSVYPEPFQHAGIGGTSYGWGYDLDGWLQMPSLDFSLFSSVELSFWWMSSYYWHVYPNDNGDLFVQISTDGGQGWDTLWTFGDSLAVVLSGCPWPWEDWQWYQATLDLTGYIGESDVIIGYHVVADDNADIGMDDIFVDTTQVRVIEETVYDLPWSFSCVSNPASSGSLFRLHTDQVIDVQITIYDTAGRVLRILQCPGCAPGEHRIAWDGLDQYASPAPAGVYFVECRKGEERITQNLILLR